MKPITAIDDWIRQSFQDGHVTVTTANEKVGRSYSTRSHVKSGDRKDITSQSNGKHPNPNRQSSSRKYVEKLIDKISKWNNLFGSECDQISEVSNVTSGNTSNDWPNCHMGDVSSYHTTNDWPKGHIDETSFYTRKDGSPVTISSGYESDSLPTFEEEIDGLLHTDKRVGITAETEETRDLGYGSRIEDPVLQHNFRAWPGRRDLSDEKRLERNNNKLTRVKKSMRGIIKDLKEPDAFDVHRTRRSRSFENSNRKLSNDQININKHRKSFSESRRNMDGYFVMECYHGPHWVDTKAVSEINISCVVCHSTQCRNGCDRLVDNVVAKACDIDKDNGHRHRKKGHGRKHKHGVVGAGNQKDDTRGHSSDHTRGHSKLDIVKPSKDSMNALEHRLHPDTFGVPLLTSTPRSGNSKPQNDYEEEHIYETIPGDEASVDWTPRVWDVPPALPERNYKGLDILASSKSRRKNDEIFFNSAPCDINNNSVPKFWDRLDGVARDKRGRGKGNSLESMTLERPRRSPLSSRSQREDRKSKSMPMVTCAKTSKKRDELDVTKLKKKSRSFHDYTVADVLDSISRIESDEPDLIQDTARREGWTKGVNGRCKTEDLFYGVTDLCHKMAESSSCSKGHVIGNEIII